MTSNDNQQYTTAQIFRPEIGGLRAEIRSGFSEIRGEIKELRAEIQAVKDTALVNSAKIDAYRDFTGIWFTVIAVIVALIGFMATAAPFLREIYRDAKKHEPQETLTEEKVQAMINVSVTQAVAQALKNLDTVRGGIS